MRLKKVDFGLFLALIALIFLIACSDSSGSVAETNDGASSSEDSEEYVLRLAHGFSSTHYMHTFMEWFDEQVQERSEGRLSIDIYPNGQLMPATEEVPALVQGQIDMVHSTSPILTSFDPIWNFFELPFLFDYEVDDPSVFLENRTAFNQHEDGGRKIADRMEDKGVKVLGFAYIDTFGSLFTNNHSINDIDSVEGLRVRTPGGIITPETVEALGASSITVAGAEAITALQQGVVDGALSTPMYVYDVKFPVDTYIVAPLFNSVTPVLISQDTFESLPSDLQDILVQVGEDYEQYVLETINEELAETLPKLENEMGVEFYYPTEEEINKMKEVSRSAWEVFENEVEGGGDLIDVLSTINE
ncbi:TRAP transporter substrate-binding protein [Desertibacillus haloalkaliphilus]|uniref:TRAP transporter substrate-binding protein n=1 Tax=Desertibacillus haloalkaliphilus TaxID=1328930 RepID=UPI001C25A3C7|nr:TRAP transporter substrate-binding protein [Desertibacillus haloalkaliphilus]MBU8906232.1 TRAP transporter substrate-binding protein [Desertibacillus haloalkaliphilus]